LGYANITTWNQVSCNVGTTTFIPPGLPTFCGDTIVQTPNKSGFNEQCESREAWPFFQARGGGTKAQWVESIYKCKPNCTLGCAGVPNESKIGEGCYLDLNNNGIKDAAECQKGKYVCDFATNTVKCTNVYGDASFKGMPQFQGCPLYDYCCNSGSAELADGEINSNPFTIVKANVSDIVAGASGILTYANLGAGTFCSPQPGCVGSPLAGFGAGKGFRCDDVCKNVGKVCVGVGFTDPSLNSCVYVRHDDGSAPGGCNNNGRTAISMDLPANQAATNCDAWFGMFYYSNSGGTGLHYSTGYDNYVYYCTDNDPLNFWTIYQPGAGYSGFNVTPNNSICRPTAPDTCGFHGFDLIETACYCM